MSYLTGNSINLTEKDCRAVRDSLHNLEDVLENRLDESDAQRIRIRLSLSEAEEVVRRALDRSDVAVAEKVDHLNATSGLGVRPLREIIGPTWPKRDS